MNNLTEKIVDFIDSNREFGGCPDDEKIEWDKIQKLCNDKIGDRYYKLATEGRSVTINYNNAFSFDDILVDSDNALHYYSIGTNDQIKLARCYRVLNLYEMAEMIYIDAKKIYQEDASVKHSHVQFDNPVWEHMEMAMEFHGSGNPCANKKSVLRGEQMDIDTRYGVLADCLHIMDCVVQIDQSESEFKVKVITKVFDVLVQFFTENDVCKKGDRAIKLIKKIHKKLNKDNYLRNLETKLRKLHTIVKNRMVKLDNKYNLLVKPNAVSDTVSDTVPDTMHVRRTHGKTKQRFDTDDKMTDKADNKRVCD